MIRIFLIILLILELIIAVKNIRIAYGFFAIIILLISSFVKFNVGGINFNSFNLAMIVLVLASLKEIFGKKCLYPKVRKLIIFYILYVSVTSLLVASAFSQYIQNMFLLVMEYGLLGYIMCWTKMSDRELKIMDIILGSVGFIIIAYGIVAYIIKGNPYMMYVCSSEGVEINMSEIFSEEQRWGLGGRSSSFFSHPLMLGQWSVLFFSYVFCHYKEKIPLILYYIYIILIILMPIISGSRSAIFPMLTIVVISFFYQSNRRKIVMATISILLLFIIHQSLSANTRQSIDSMLFFWDDKTSMRADIQGSTTDRRFEQFETALKVIQDNLIIGKGYNYGEKNRDSLPTILAGQESIYISFLIDGGLLGLLLFNIFYFKLYSILRRRAKNRENRLKADVLCIPFYINICLTGLFYSFFAIFLMFYMVTLYRIDE